MALHPNAYMWLSQAGSAALSVLALRGTALHGFFATPPAQAQPRRNHFMRGNEIIDEVMACAEEHMVVVTFHGGAAVRVAVESALTEAGFMAATLHPFGSGRFEQETLGLLQHAKGPAAASMVLEASRQGAAVRAALADGAAMLEETRTCRFLFTPPRVQLWGPVNAGKSSLLNALCGRRVAATGPEPGLTRDVLEGLVEHRGFEVRVFDAPGAWAAARSLDQAALELAARWRSQSDLTLHLLPPGHSPPPPEPETWVINSRIDESGLSGVSALTPATVEALKDRLVDHFFGPLAALPPHRRWALHPQLRADLASGAGHEWLADSGP